MFINRIFFKRKNHYKFQSGKFTRWYPLIAEIAMISIPKTINKHFTVFTYLIYFCLWIQFWEFAFKELFY